MVDPYEILGVPQSSNKEDIKKAYRKLAMKHHPDKGGDEDKFKEISEAYSILSDDDKRRQYEAHRQGAPPGFGGFGGFEDLFNEMFSGGRRHPRQQPKRRTTDDDIRFNLGVTLNQIKRGAKQKIDFQRSVDCKECKGIGGEGKSNCGPCRGSGVETVMNRNTIHQSMCRHCHGAGHAFEKVCQKCRGAGMYRVKDSIIVEIKKG